MCRVALMLVVLVATLGLLPTSSASAVPRDGAYIIVLRNDTSAGEFAHRHGLTPRHLFRRVFNGLAVSLTDAQARRLASDDGVVTLAPDRQFHVDAVQATLPGGSPSLPPSIDRIDAEFAPIVATVGIAVLDTGIDLGRPEFNLQGAISFVAGAPTAQDDHGHGTHVAGIAAATVMPSGFRGVAPHAPLWALKVLDGSGTGSDSSVIAAIDWLTLNGPALGIRVANMSLKGEGSDTANCGVSGSTIVDPLHYAICQAVQAGIMFTAAAGNGSIDASGGVPAAYPEVITVSNIQDRDGRGGAQSPPNDDAFSPTSDFGPAVDIAAPGTAVLSTLPTGGCLLCSPTGYARLSGTSMSAPAVAGALATYVALHPATSTVGAPGTLAPAGTALIAQAKPQSDWCGFTGDPDALPEPMLYVGIPDGDCGAIATPDSDGDGLPDDVETQIYGTDPNVGDTDADGCGDGKEVGPAHVLGGQRDPLYHWDFYDVTGDKSVDLTDTLLILAHFGHGPNDDALDNELDRAIGGPGFWNTIASDTGIDLTDALVNLRSFGDDCSGPP